VLYLIVPRKRYRAWFSAILLSCSVPAIADSVTNDSLYRLAKDFNDPITYYLVARKYFVGNEYPLDKKQAAKWFKKAADAGHGKAQWYLGRMYAKGDGVSKNSKLAIKYLQQASQNGQEEAYYDLALVYLYDNGDKPDYIHATEWLDRAAKNDHAKAAFLLGKLAVDGKLKNYDLFEAEKWLRLASELGIEESKEYLARLEKLKPEQANPEIPPPMKINQVNHQQIRKNPLKTPEPTDNLKTTALLTQINMILDLPARQNKSTEYKENDALENIVSRALKGQAKAQYRLGMQLLQSANSRELAVEWRRKASNQGHTDASYQLGVLYRDGTGVQRSDNQALNLFRQASVADASNPETAEKAASALNDMLISSDHRLFNEKAGHNKISPLESLILDAKNGRLEAQLKLADMYQRGIGVTKNDQLAGHWLKQVEKQKTDDNSHNPTQRCKRC